MAAKVLIIEDDDGFRAALAMMVKLLGYEAAFPEQGGRASHIRTALLAADYDLVITDVLMPEMDGLEVIRMLRSVKPDCPVVAISGGGKRTSALTSLGMAESFGADKVLYKPFRRDELASVLKSLIRG